MECKDIKLDSRTITTVPCYERTYIIGAAPLRAQISHICMWFVVNRAAYGESLRLFNDNNIKKTKYEKITFILIDYFSKSTRLCV